MTKGDLLKTLATEKKRETNTINKIGDVYVVMFMSLYLWRQLWNWLKLKCLNTAINTYWILHTILYEYMYTQLQPRVEITQISIY